jgi:hypothetical protein
MHGTLQSANNNPECGNRSGGGQCVLVEEVDLELTSAQGKLGGLVQNGVTCRTARVKE